MWIRTQDRETLLNVDYFDIYEYPLNGGLQYKLLGGKNQNELDLLGFYETKERTLEVLDEIQQYVLGKIFVPTELLNYEEKNTAKYSIVGGVDKIETLPLVYEMPSE